MKKLLRIGGNVYPWRKILGVSKHFESVDDRLKYQIKVIAKGLKEVCHTFPDEKTRDAYFEEVIKQREGKAPEVISLKDIDPLPANREAIKEALQVTVALYVGMGTESPNFGRMKELLEAIK